MSLVRFVLLVITFNLSASYSIAEEINKIQWEVQNRFLPFEAYRGEREDNSPSAVFERWRFEPNESFEEWHRRLWSTLGDEKFESPFAKLIRDQNIDQLWHASTDTYDTKIRDFIHGSGKVQIGASVDFDGECEWLLNERRIGKSTCRKDESNTWPISFSIPLDATVNELTVRIASDGKLISETLEVKNLVIVGLGDSYSSGQGNPDIPASWKSWTRSGSPSTDTLHWLRQPKSYLDGRKRGQAAWIDEDCYRSFFNYQTLTALKIASEKTDHFVSFLHYSCSGAEIFDGILNPQTIPSESRIAQENAREQRHWYQSKSQLFAAVSDLCASTPVSIESYPKHIIEAVSGRGKPRFFRQNDFSGQIDRTASRRKLRAGYARQRENRTWVNLQGNTPFPIPSDALPVCDDKHFKKPDLVLIGIGGNDAAFESLVTYYLVPKRFVLKRTGNYLILPDICPRTNNIGNNAATKSICKSRLRTTGYDTRGLTEGVWGTSKCYRGRCRSLAERYEVASDAISTALRVETQKLVIPIYPDPFRTPKLPVVALDERLPNYAGHREKKNGPYLSVGQKPDQYDPVGNWNAAPATGSAFTRTLASDWQFNLTANEAELLLREVEEIRAQQRTAAANGTFVLSLGTRDAFLKNNWMSGMHPNLPNSSTNSWDPMNWEPYRFEENGRAIRTINDSFLTQQNIDSPDNFRNIEVPDYRGAGHPNLTGHRLLAEHVYMCASAALLGASAEGCLSDQPLVEVSQ